MKNLLGELSAQEHKFVELEKEDDGIAICQLELLMLNCSIHDILQGPDNGGKHNNRPGRSVIKLDVAHQEHEQVLNLNESCLRLNLS